MMTFLRGQERSGPRLAGSKVIKVIAVCPGPRVHQVLQALLEFRAWLEQEGPRVRLDPRDLLEPQGCLKVTQKT